MPASASRTPRQQPARPSGSVPSQPDPPPVLSPNRKACHPSTGSVSDSSLDAIMRKLSALDVLSSQISDIGSHLECVQKDMQVMKESLADMEQRVVDRCAQNTVDSIAKYDQEVTSQLARKLERMSNQMDEDRARKEAVIVGIPHTANRKAVEEWLNSFEAKFSTLRTFSRNGRTTGLLSFSDSSHRDMFLTRFRAEARMINVDGKDHAVTAFPGKSKLQRDRNFSLKKKCEELQSKARTGQSYSIDWPTRSIVLNGKPTLKQKRFSTEFEEPDWE